MLRNDGWGKKEKRGAFSHSLKGLGGKGLSFIYLAFLRSRAPSSAPPVTLRVGTVVNCGSDRFFFPIVTLRSLSLSFGLGLESG